MSSPLVSVIIPTYNYAKFISEAIDSVLKQTYPTDKIEIIVIDDGSTDNTREKLQAYSNLSKYIYQNNIGKAAATKAGIACASGKYLFNLDADDLFFPDKIEKVVNIFEGDSEIVHIAHLAFCWNVERQTQTSEVIPEVIKGRKIFGQDLLIYFYKQKMLFGGGSTFAARTEILKSFQIPKEVDMFIDEYLVLFTLREGYSFLIDQSLSIWRIHGHNYSKLSPNSSTFNAKNIRLNDSIEAVLNEVLKGKFYLQIKELYLLKSKVEKLAFKENYAQKSMFDILDLWLFIFQHSKAFSQNFPNILKSYSVVNRTIPTFLLQYLKKYKRNYPL
jgi:glycosyltransferase involved in cell wall biosynthesis